MMEHQIRMSLGKHQLFYTRTEYLLCFPGIVFASFLTLGIKEGNFLNQSVVSLPNQSVVKSVVSLLSYDFFYVFLEYAFR